MAALANENFDPRYEFDARQHYDFDTRSTGSQASDWFAAQAAAAFADAETVGEAGPSGRSPLKETNAAKVTDAPMSAGKAAGAGAAKKASKNIVTSWGADVKKRKGEPGAPQQAGTKTARKGANEAAAAGAAEPALQQAAAKPVATSSGVPRTRGQHAAAAARASIAKQLKAVVKPGVKGPKSLKVVKAARLSKVLAPRRNLPARSTKQLTVPVELQLATSRRAKEHPKPDCAHAKQADPGVSPYKPLVLRVREFESKTPARFKRKPEPLPPHKPLGITEPKEPQLYTTTRTRPSVFKPREVEEVEAMAHMPVFRASTLNPLILKPSSCQIGVPKVDKREATEPAPFHFITDDRADARARRAQTLEELQAQAEGEKEREQREREAAREAAKRARKSVAVLQAEPHALVKPRSPLLLTKLRARESKVEEPRQEFHARPVPKFLSVPSIDPLALHHEPPALTQPAPFRLATESRGERHRQSAASRQAAEEEAARRARIPRAHGLPLSTDMPLVPPKPEPRALTVPEPFGLASEARHEEYMAHKRRELEAEEEAKRAEAEFKARPMWRGVPFRLHDSELPLTVPEDVPLATRGRVREREAFNRGVEERWREQEVAAQLAAQERRAREEEEVRQLRKAAQFHARPMPDLSVPPPPKALPPKPLTKPRSPKLGRAKRKSAGDAA